MTDENTGVPADTQNATQGHDTDTDTAEQINAMIRYAMYSVFAVDGEVPDKRRRVIKEAEKFLDGLAAKDVVVRGLYDVGGLRADADLMVWWHAPTIEALQEAYRGLRRTDLGSILKPVWSVAGLHRPAEFNRAHVPDFMTGAEPKKYLCLYPFVRSYDWYILPPDERSRMLREHGQAAREYPDVRGNTVSAFALGDYEWLLAFEAEELHRIVDVMRDLRAVDARLHVREETPFYTGPRTTLADFVESLR